MTNKSKSECFQEKNKHQLKKMFKRKQKTTFCASRDKSVNTKKGRGKKQAQKKMQGDQKGVFERDKETEREAAMD